MRNTKLATWDIEELGTLPSSVELQETKTNKTLKIIKKKNTVSLSLSKGRTLSLDTAAPGARGSGTRAL